MSPSTDPGSPLDPADVASELSEADEAVTPGVEQEQPQDPLSRLYRLMMAGTPPPQQAGRQFGEDITWDMHMASAIEGMSGTDGVPVFMRIVIAVVLLMAEMADEQPAEGAGDLSPEDIDGLGDG